ncbi:MAG: type II toxin-antitoxin system VapC family toxin [Gammaproteobacteria bacterium]|nr:type II toxin-antitoxin system VapC family toxin [Gammaproteobacteria bacterium]MDE0368378.1 type II toxin-antitoxin system VapC family toxin [Gammaproteobacteria bacterium]
MRAVDTNVLVRLIVRDDPEQVESSEAFVTPGAWVSHLVLAETVWVLKSVYGLDSAGIATAVEMLVEHDRLVLQDGDVVQNALAAFRQQSSVGFVDCLILKVARKLGHRPLGTFDKSMSRLDDAVRL